MYAFGASELTGVVWGAEEAVSPPEDDGAAEFESSAGGEGRSATEEEDGPAEGSEDGEAEAVSLAPELAPELPEAEPPEL